MDKHYAVALVYREVRQLMERDCPSQLTHWTDMFDEGISDRLESPLPLVFISDSAAAAGAAPVDGSLFRLSLMETLDQQRVLYEQRHESITVAARSDQTGQLSHRIGDFYERFWRSARGTSPSALMQSLPHALQIEICSFLYIEALTRLPVFAGWPFLPLLPRTDVELHTVSVSFARDRAPYVGRSSLLALSHTHYLSPSHTHSAGPSQRDHLGAARR